MGISYKRSGARYDRAHQDRVRQKIADANVLNRLLDCYEGKVELTQSQVAIGLNLMRKIVPDLSASEVELTEQAPFAVIPAPLRDDKAWEAKYKPAAVTPLSDAPKASGGKSKQGKATQH